MRYLLAEGGESRYYIVNHRYADEAVRYAAAELQRLLLRATGAALPYFSDRCKRVGPEIRIGEAVRGAAPTAGLAPEAYLIRAEGEDILITGGSPRGVVYGVYHFLRTFCGYRAYTHDSERIDSLDRLEIELDEISGEPAFEFREAYFRYAFNGDFCVRNGLNANLGDISRARGGGMRWYNFHHSFRDLCPEEVWFDRHPEYFSQINGERCRGAQICLSNPEVFAVCRDSLRRQIRENPHCRVFSVAQNDNDRRCTCPACLAIEEEEGSPAGPIIRFVNALADDIAADYPDVLLHTFAYMYSVPAPKKAVARDSVIVRLCTFGCRFDKPLSVLAEEDPTGQEAKFCRALSDWQTHCKRLYVWDYVVNFRNYAQPHFNFHVIAENIRYFAKMGVRGVLAQGNFAHGGGCAADEMKSYLIARLLLDPATDVDRELYEYCHGVYGAAGDTMLAYYRRMEEACTSAPLTIYLYPDAPFITDGLLAECRALFDRALAEAEPWARPNVAREELSLRFLTLSRLPLETEGREAAVRAFIRDVKGFGITELFERSSIAVAEAALLTSLYARKRPPYTEHWLYYTMQ